MISGSLAPARRAPEGMVVQCGPQAQRLAGDLARAESGQADALVFVGPSWETRVRVWESRLSADQRRAARAAFIHDGEPDVWEARPLEDAMACLSGLWVMPHIERDGLTAHLQPMLHLGTRRIYGFEALARAQDGSTLRGGGEIVEACRALNLIHDFEVGAASAALHRGLHQLVGEERLFVNLLPGSVADRERTEAVIELCRKRRAPLNRLVFEVMESEAFRRPEEFCRSAQELRATGALVALDDVGSGYSDFSAIVALRPDIVKLDRTLLRLEDEHHATGLMRALVDSAHSQDCLVVAEGVETERHLMLAERAGVDIVQGWHIGHPAAVADRSAASASLF